MKLPKVGFIVYGVHKDGLKDPMGTPFIDDKIISNAKETLKNAGLQLVEYDLVIATKEEAKECFSKFKKDDDIDAIILFSGTWVWAAHLIAPIRDFSSTGKGIILWTNPGHKDGDRLEDWFCMELLKKSGSIIVLFMVDYKDATEVNKVVSYCRASHEKNILNMSTIRCFRRTRYGTNMRSC